MFKFIDEISLVLFCCTKKSPSYWSRAVSYILRVSTGQKFATNILISTTLRYQKTEIFKIDNGCKSWKISLEEFIRFDVKLQKLFGLNVMNKSLIISRCDTRYCSNSGGMVGKWENHWNRRYQLSILKILSSRIN